MRILIVGEQEPEPADALGRLSSGLRFTVKFVLAFVIAVPVAAYAVDPVNGLGGVVRGLLALLLCGAVAAVLYRRARASGDEVTSWLAGGVMAGAGVGLVVFGTSMVALP